jgi:hypothetical protein
MCSSALFGFFVAALSYANARIGYPIWASDIGTDTNKVFGTADRNTILKPGTTFDTGNNLGCPLS